MNLIRAYKLFIQRYCMKKGAVEALVDIGGDGYDPAMQNAQLATGTFHVTLLIENHTEIPTDWLSDATIALHPVNELTDAPLPPSPSGGTVKGYVKADVAIDASAVDADHAEVFVTNAGKLATDQNGHIWPRFAVVPIVQTDGAGDYQIVLDGDPVLTSDGDVQFRAYISSINVPPPGNNFKFTVIIFLF